MNFKQQQLKQAAYDLGFAFKFSSHNSSVSFNAEQLQYIQQRASAYDLEAADVIAMMPASLANDPDAAIRFLKGSELSHIVSQSSAPHLADEPSNIILEPADGSNQARGALEISDSELRVILEEQQALANESISPPWLDYSYDLLGIAFTALRINEYMDRWIAPEVRHKCAAMVHAIMHTFSHFDCQKSRKAAAHAITSFIETTLADHGAWAVAIMAIALINCPWLAGLLVARGLVALARMASNSLRNLCNLLFGDALDPYFHVAQQCLNVIFSGIEAAVRIVEQAALWLGDVLCTAYKATKNIVQSAWKGLMNAASWLGRMFNQQNSYATA